MARFEASVVIRRAQEEVFEFLMQPENNLRWQPGLVSSTLATPGPIGVGTRIREVRRFLKVEVRSTYEIRVHEPPAFCATACVDGPVPFAATYEVTPVGTGCRVRATGQLPPRSVPRVTERMILRVAGSEISSNLERLRATLESDALIGASAGS